MVTEAAPTISLQSGPDETSWEEAVANARAVSADETGEPTVTGTPPESTDTPAREVPLCQECGEPIAYSGRGRKPKWHPEHRPGSKGNTGQSRERVGRAGSKSKAEREAEQIAESFLAKANQLAILAGIADPFDGLAIAIGGKAIAKDISGALPNYPRVREALLSADQTTSIASIPLHFLLLILVPILAHHGIIPSEINGKPIGKLLEQLPAAFSTLEKKTAAAADKLAEDLANASNA